MKKYMLAPLCSALVTPGLGQIVNRHLKKGLLTMAAVFVLLVAAAIEVFKLLKNMLPFPAETSIAPKERLVKWQAADLSMLDLIGVVFAAIWLYSVVDALIYGIRLEKQDGPQSR